MSESEIASTPTIPPKPPQEENSPAIETRGLDDQTGQETQANPSALSSHHSHPAFEYNASIHPLDTAGPQAHPTIAPIYAHAPHSAGLRLQTTTVDIPEGRDPNATNYLSPTKAEFGEQATSALGALGRSGSVRSIRSGGRQTAGSLSPASVLSSPGVGPLIDITPLPSPITANASPGPWHRAMERSRPQEAGSPTLTKPPPSGEPIMFSPTPPRKKKYPVGLMTPVEEVKPMDSQMTELNLQSHERNRSLSEYVPDAMQATRPRNIVVSTSGAPTTLQLQSPPEQALHREPYLAAQRGIAIPIQKPPTPPRTSSTAGESQGQRRKLDAEDRLLPPVYEAYSIRTNKLKKWRAIRPLGQGSFSNVMLATSDLSESADRTLSTNLASPTTTEEEGLDRKSLVAVKICEHGPAGGADEQRVEVSLKRELDLLKSIEHPCVVHLKAVNVLEERAFLVLNYCAGGDLYELAFTHPDYLVPGLVRRVFAELVAAVKCLHDAYIVHRDIKLENVLVNIPVTQLPSIDNWQTYPGPVVTLTDLGLGRWIPKPPDSPMLENACGSVDYCAPEMLMNQEYDGRATDAWALGVLLYAIMESRLPFDPLPNARRPSPPKHRIARCEWSWFKWADDDGEWDPSKGVEFAGAEQIVDGLLKWAHRRWSLERVQETQWVNGGIQVEGGLRRDEDVQDDDEL